MRPILTVLLAIFTIDMSAAESYRVDTARSRVLWEGSKRIDSHNGDLRFLKGELNFSGEKLTGCSFVVDMKSINSTDVSGKKKKNLDGHLKNQDFFHVETFPRASLDCKKITPKGKTYEVDGALTIKGKTLPTKFVFNSVVKTKGGVVAKTNKFSFDRIKYGVMYAAKTLMQKLHPKNWKDKVIKKEIEIQANITAIKS